MKLHYSDVKDSILDVKKDRRTDVFLWGKDNAFPSLIKTLINNSVTAKICTDKVAKSIYGKSFGEVGGIIVNGDGQTLNEVLRIAAREFATYNNLFIHVGYNGELKHSTIKVVPVEQCRIGKDDDSGYSGKIIKYDNWNKQKGRVNDEAFQYIDRYNPIKKVIESQINAAGDLRKYKGQIIHIQKDTNSVYSLPDLNPVISEALLEANSQTFRSRGAEKGFLNTKLMTVQPFQDDDDRRTFIKKLDSLQGADNSGNVLVLESGQQTDDLASQVKLDDLSSQYNDKLFEYSDMQARKNIALAYGVPLGLIDVSETSLFGNSGELIKQMNVQLWDSREEERDVIEEVFNRLMKNWKDPIQLPLEIISPYEAEQAASTTNTEG